MSSCSQLGDVVPDDEAIAAAAMPRQSRLDRHQDYEVMVVDNSTGAKEVRLIAECHGARYICEPRIGLSRARNTSARAARGNIVAFIDDDALPAPEWLSQISAAFRDRDVVARTGRVLLSHAETPVARTFADLGGYDLGRMPMRVHRNTPLWFERTNFGGLGSGTNLAFRRALFVNGWGFQERLGRGRLMAGEERYALFELVRDGYVVSYLPDAVVHHDPPASFEALDQLSRSVVREAAAHIVMLLVEESGYRPAALRYALQGCTGTPRAWRPPVSQKRQLSYLPRLRSAAGGPWLYARARLPAPWKPLRVPTPRQIADGDVMTGPAELARGQGVKGSRQPTGRLRRRLGTNV